MLVVLLRGLRGVGGLPGLNVVARAGVASKIAGDE